MDSLIPSWMTQYLLPPPARGAFPRKRCRTILGNVAALVERGNSQTHIQRRHSRYEMATLSFYFVVVDFPTLFLIIKSIFAPRNEDKVRLFHYSILVITRSLPYSWQILSLLLIFHSHNQCPVKLVKMSHRRDGSRYSRYRTLNDPSGRGDIDDYEDSHRRRGRGPPSSPGMVRTTFSGSFSAATLHCETQLRFYSLTFHDNTRHLMAVHRNCLDPELFAQLLEMLYDMHFSTKGIAKRYTHLKLLPHFSVNGGPLTQRCKADIKLCTALVACQVAFGIGYFMCNSVRSLEQWSMNYTEYYDRAITAAACITNMLLKAAPPGSATFDIPTVSEIMNFDIWVTLHQRQRQLKIHGVVSEHGRGVANGRDILGGVYYPTYLFLDSILPENEWHNHCPNRLLWIDREELANLRTNSRFDSSA